MDLSPRPSNFPFKPFAFPRVKEYPYLQQGELQEKTVLWQSPGWEKERVFICLGSSVSSPLAKNFPALKIVSFSLLTGFLGARSHVPSLGFLQVQKWQKEPQTPDVYGCVTMTKEKDLKPLGQETSWPQTEAQEELGSCSGGWGETSS